MTLMEKCMEMMEKYAHTKEQSIELESDLIEFAKIVSDMQAEKIRKAIDVREGSYENS